ncbi:MAG: type II toxin-antitoxin system VapC family toxin [Candidatus Eremiobacterota bacterium]
MVLCDVSVLLQASAPKARHHARCRAALLELTSAQEPFAVSELILAAVVRLATNPRIFQPPATPSSAFRFAEALLAHPRCVPLSPGARHWRIFKDLVLNADILGSDTTDAYLAALAMEHGCMWWTTDSDFGRFEGLRWRNLLVG